MDKIILASPKLKTYEVIQYTTTNSEIVKKFLDRDYIYTKEGNRIIYSNPNTGRSSIRDGDWIVKKNGLFYKYTDAEFKQEFNIRGNDE